jgi:dissimilatory sulfite reductase (desulfoviridin) alpha/beta subunit
MDHISHHDLERFHLRLVKDDVELAIIEEHLMTCARCIDAAEDAAHYVDAIRVAIIVGNFDLE